MVDGVSKVRCSMAKRGETRKTVLSKKLFTWGCSALGDLTGLVGWQALALFSFGLRELRLRVMGRVETRLTR